MSDPTVAEKMRAASASMQAASDAIDRGEWRNAEKALFEAVEGIGRVLRELGLKQVPPGC